MNLPSLNIDELEKQSLQLPQVPCPVIHHFGPGVYIREVTIPAGSLAIGHHQVFEQMNIFLRGRLTILLDDGTTKEMVAPQIFTGKAGRKVGYIHEDVSWLNVYATGEKNVETLEAMFLNKTEGWVSTAPMLRGLKLIQDTADKDDFLRIISDLGFTELQVRQQSEEISDMCDLPLGSYKIKVGPSDIEGQGLFATADIDIDEIIAPARINEKRTVAGRFTNHSANPNAKMVKGAGTNIDLVAIRKISGCVGGLDGDEITVDYRSTFALNQKLRNEEIKCQE